MFMLSVVVMETETIRLLKARRVTVLASLSMAQAELSRLQAEYAQIEAALRAMAGPLLANGYDASERAREHFAAKANPEIARMTMKEMVVKALGEHFPHGATANQLLDFFRSEWGREQMRTSLSPQLSRLKDRHIITLKGKVWHLAPNENGPPEGGPEADEVSASSIDNSCMSFDL
jgi:phosphopantetheinyl transferase (holo-ACP synthase)